MAGERGRLTDLQIRHWVRAGVPMAKADGGGLTFTLSTGGATGWILRYSHGGRRRELTIGRYPDITLADARGIATIKRAEIMQGRNPAADKQKAKATAAKDWTVRELVKDYRAKKLVSLAHSTQVSYGRHLKRVEEEARRADRARNPVAERTAKSVYGSSHVHSPKYGCQTHVGERPPHARKYEIARLALRQCTKQVGGWL
jgi:Arm DNA-binding domain